MSGVTAVIQARMGSSRYPGKSLCHIGGLPLIGHVIERVRRSRQVGRIVLATTNLAQDRPLAQYGASQRVEVYCGSADNLLERFAGALAGDDAEFIVRVNGDAPFVDWRTIDRIAGLLADHDADFSFVNPKTPCIHAGFELFSRRSFDRLLEEAADDAVAREHVTGYFVKHPDFVKSIVIDFPEDECFTGARISIDTPRDGEFIEAVYRALDVETPKADVVDVVALLKAKPSLLNINRHVHQKGLDESELVVLMVAQCGHETGYGHLTRCLTMAQTLRDMVGAKVSFWISADPLGTRLMSEHHFTVESCPDGEFDQRIESLIATQHPACVVVDIKDNLISTKRLDQWRRSGIKVALIDDGSVRRHHCDLDFFAPVPQVSQMGFNDPSVVRAGWPYVIIPKNENDPNLKPGPTGGPVIGVLMGRSDPNNLTCDVIGALSKLERSLSLVVITGGGYLHTKTLEEVIENSPHTISHYREVKSIGPYLAGTDLVISAFGVTAFELAALGKPAVHVCLDEDAASSSALFSNEGVSLCAGVAFEPDWADKTATLVETLLDEPRSLERMVKRATGLGLRAGGVEVAQEIAKMATTRRVERV